MSKPTKRKADSQPTDEQPKKLARTGTMATTVAESHKIVGKEPLGDRKAKKGAKPVEEEPPQKLARASTIQQTLESSKRVLKDGELGERKAKKAAADKKEAEKHLAEKKKAAAAEKKKSDKDEKPKEKLARAGTMEKTVAESHKIIGKDGELGERKAKKVAADSTSPASSPRKKPAAAKPAADKPKKPAAAAAAKPAADKPKKPAAAAAKPAADKPKKPAAAKPKKPAAAEGDDDNKLARAGTMATTVAESHKIIGKEPLGERKAKKPAAPAAAAEGKRAGRGKKKADADA